MLEVAQALGLAYVPAIVLELVLVIVLVHVLVLAPAVPIKGADQDCRQGGLQSKHGSFRQSPPIGGAKTGDGDCRERVLVKVQHHTIGFAAPVAITMKARPTVEGAVGDKLLNAPEWQ